MKKPLFGVFGVKRCLLFVWLLWAVEGVCQPGHAVVTALTVDSLFAVCEAQVRQDPEESVALAEALLAYAQEQEDEGLQAKSNYLVGRAYRYLGTAEQGLDYLTTSIAQATHLAAHRQLCLSLKELGAAHYTLHQYAPALTAYQQAMALARAHHFVPEMNALYNNLGTLYNAQAQYDQAIAYYKQALQTTTDRSVQGTLYLNLGMAYAGKGVLDTAMLYDHKSAALAEQRHDVAARIAALNGIASIYWSQDEYDKLLTLSFTVLGLQKEAGLVTDRIETLNRIGLSYLNKGDARTGLDYLQQALALAQSIQYPKTHYIYANLAFASEALGDYEHAYTYFVEHKTLQDSLDDAATKRHLDELLTRYEADKKAQQIKTLTLEKEQAATVRKGLVGGGILLLTLIVISWLFYRQKMTLKLQRMQQAEMISRQQTLTLIRNHELQTMQANLEGREQERLRLSQELHDGIAGTLAGIKHMAQRMAGTQAVEGLDDVVHHIDEVYEEVRTISHNLSPHKVLHTAFIDLLKKQLQQVADQGGFTGEFICFPEATLNQLPDPVKIEIYRILQELFTNILRHAKATEVSVHFTQTDTAISLLVEDNGKGFAAGKAAAGVGLANMQHRAAALHGKLTIDTAPGRGTIVNIEIPRGEF